MIEAEERRDVATVDIPNAFIQTDMGDEVVIVKARGILADLLVAAAPKVYSDYLIKERGRKVTLVEYCRWVAERSSVNLPNKS